MTTPAEQLLGVELNNGWKVIEKLETNPELSDSGGFFSCQYLVQRSDGYRAFLKAMDFRGAFGAPNPMLEMQRLTAEFLYEKEINKHCSDKKLSRVVRCLDAGDVEIDPSAIDKGRVEYLIFEKADNGDVRQHIRLSPEDTTAWSLKALHEIAVGVQQLHANSIAHLDIKPSNAVVFESHGTKVSDLGSSVHEEKQVPHAIAFSGDKTYAPPEVLYNYNPPDWRTHRLGCDLYMLGGILVFFFCGASMTARLEAELAPVHRYASGIKYDAALPYLQHAFSSVLRDLQTCFPEPIRKDLTEMVAQLCEPDFNRRGHPKNLAGKYIPQHGLERFVGKLATLSKKASIEAKRIK